MCSLYTNAMTTSSRLLKSSHAARYGVKIRLKIAGARSGKRPVNCAFSPDFALSRTHLRTFQQPARVELP